MLPGRSASHLRGAPADVPTANKLVANDLAGAEVRAGLRLPPGTDDLQERPTTTFDAAFGLALRKGGRAASRRSSRGFAGRALPLRGDRATAGPNQLVLQQWSPSDHVVAALAHSYSVTEARPRGAAPANSACSSVVSTVSSRVAFGRQSTLRGRLIPERKDSSGSLADTIGFRANRSRGRSRRDDCSGPEVGGRCRRERNSAVDAARLERLDFCIAGLSTVRQWRRDAGRGRA